jgi:hypothetical protein
MPSQSIPMTRRQALFGGVSVRTCHGWPRRCCDRRASAGIGVGSRLPWRRAYTCVPQPRARFHSVNSLQIVKAVARHMMLSGSRVATSADMCRHHRPRPQCPGGVGHFARVALTMCGASRRRCRQGQGREHRVPRGGDGRGGRPRQFEQRAAGRLHRGSTPLAIPTSRINRGFA